MNSLATDPDRIPPIWERLPQVFAYPLKSASLAALGLYGILFSVGIVIPVIGLLFLLGAWVGLYKFAYDVLEATARGREEPPDVQSGTTSWVLVKTFVLFFVLGFAVALIGGVTESLFLMAIVALFVVAALPAAIIILAMTNSLLNALNPLTWVGIMRVVGLPYFIASLLLFMLAISQGTAEYLLASVVGMGFLGSLGGFLIGGYFLVASFHLMGYLVHQHHEALGVDQDVEASTAKLQAESTTPLLTEADALVKEGEVDAAIALLGKNLKQGGLPEEHDRYRKLLTLQGRKEELLAHGRQYITVLLYGLEQTKKALGVAEECLKLDPRFQTAEPKQVLDMARVADDFNRHELVLRLTNGFANRHPKHPDVVENYYLAAKALFLGRGEEAKAHNILSQLQKRYPDHELREDIDRLATATAKAAGA
jgi:tetratricopeptide (TPR) repeat protein